MSHQKQLCIVWSKDEEQMLQVINRDAAYRASISASVAQIWLAEDAIKNGTVVETVGDH